MVTDYTKEKGKQIVSNIANGSTIRKEAKRLGKNHQTILNWLVKHHPEDYKNAQIMRAGVYIDSIFDISEDHSIDVQRARLMTDNIKWIACKLIPDVYGDKVIQQVDVNYTQFLDQLPPPPQIKEIDNAIN